MWTILLTQPDLAPEFNHCQESARLATEAGRVNIETFINAVKLSPVCTRMFEEINVRVGIPTLSRDQRVHYQGVAAIGVFLATYRDKQISFNHLTSLMASFLRVLGIDLSFKAWSYDNEGSRIFGPIQPVTGAATIIVHGNEADQDRANANIQGELPHVVRHPQPRRRAGPAINQEEMDAARARIDRVRAEMAAHEAQRRAEHREVEMVREQMIREEEEMRRRAGNEQNQPMPPQQQGNANPEAQQQPEAQNARPQEVPAAVPHLLVDHQAAAAPNPGQNIGVPEQEVPPGNQDFF